MEREREKEREKEKTEREPLKRCKCEYGIKKKRRAVGSVTRMTKTQLVSDASFINASRCLSTRPVCISVSVRVRSLHTVTKHNAMIESTSAARDLMLLCFNNQSGGGSCLKVQDLPCSFAVFVIVS